MKDIIDWRKGSDAVGSRKETITHDKNGGVTEGLKDIRI